MSSDSSDNSLFENFINASLNLSSGGVLGFQSGGLAPGVLADKVVEGAKEITGAAAAEEANDLARQRFEEEREKAEEQRREAQARSSRDQIIASRRAGAAQSSASNRANNANRRSQFSILGSDERDFLGL